MLERIPTVRPRDAFRVRAIAGGGIASALRPAVRIGMVLFALVFPGAAGAFQPSTAELDAIAEHAGRGGVPSSGTFNCGTVCSELWLQEHRSIPNQPSSAALHRELYALRTRTKILPTPGQVASVAGKVSLVAGAGVLGYEIGTGVRRFWLGLKQPSGPTGFPNGQQVTGAGFVQKGDVIVWNGSPAKSIYAPENGWTAQTDVGIYLQTVNLSHPGFLSDSPPCQPFSEQPPVSPGGDWQILTTALLQANVNCGPRIYIQVVAFAPLLVTQPDGQQPGAVTDWTGSEPQQPGVAMQTPPGGCYFCNGWGQGSNPTLLRQRTQTELETSPQRYPTLLQWLEYHLYHPGVEDPLGIDPPNPEIEFPGFIEHWEEHEHEFTPAYNDPVEYWRDAADIVERGEVNDPDILKCDRPSDGARIYWDSVKRAIVIVKDGKIVTYFKPPGPPPADFDYWMAQCGS